VKELLQGKELLFLCLKSSSASLTCWTELDATFNDLSETEMSRDYFAL